jgi:ribonuclease P protein subunit RPR2
MVRIARERITTLFALAERESAAGQFPLADRYVSLARRIGTRYNVRLLPEYRELYCRGCSAFWVEGRTVRTRLRSGHRVRTCLRCGRARRMSIREPARPPGGAPDSGPAGVLRDDAAVAEVTLDEEPRTDSDDESEEG